MPGAVCFGPKGAPNGSSVVTMTLDEYETIRLIDLLDQSQEACAQSMGVARTTVQAIYGSARKKLAQAICEGLELRIEGGSYYLCQGRGHGCRCPRCQREGTCADSRDVIWEDTREVAREGSRNVAQEDTQEDAQTGSNQCLSSCKEETIK